MPKYPLDAIDRRIIAELQAINDGMATPDETWAPLEPKRGDFTDAQQNGAGAASAGTGGAADTPAADATPAKSAAGEREGQPAGPSAAADSGAGTTAGQPDPAEGDKKPETAKHSPWALADDIVGQEPRRKAILELLDLAKVKADVDDIEAEHKAFLDKLGRNKAETMRKFTERQLELPERLEAEEGEGESE